MGDSPVLAADDQVLQREGRSGTLRLTREATLRITNDSGDLVVDGRCADGEVELPIGGPYRVEERDSDGSTRLLVTSLFVGDLFLLGGQSNMQGGGVLRGLEPAGPSVRLLGMERRWQQARDPLHRLWRSPDVVHHEKWSDHDPSHVDAVIEESLSTDTPHVGAGLGIAFANEYVSLTNVPVGLVPAAYGGSSLADWHPDHPAGEGACLYSGMVRMAQTAGGKVAGLLWHQGEAETGSEDTVAAYRDATRAVFDRLRKDLDQPDLPVYVAQIGFFPIIRTPEADDRWTRVRLAQLDGEALGAQGVAATLDLTLSDPIHLDATSQQRLGRRFARLATGQAQSIQLADVAHTGRLVAWPEVMEELAITLRFSGVTGSLRSSGAPSGFSVRDPAGGLVPCVWRVELEGASAVVRLAGPHVPGAALYYGHGAGASTHCNITDEADLALPCIGPVPLPDV